MSGITRVRNCSVCGKNAAYNTPYIDADNNVICERCAESSTVMLKGIEQHTDENGNYVPSQFGVFTKDHCTVWTNPQSAWTDDGRRSYRLSNAEKSLLLTDPEAVLNGMIAMRATGNYRCSSCGKDLTEEEVAGFPLFAGVECSECFQKTKEFAENERKHGHICGFCRKPYSECCC